MEIELSQLILLCVAAFFAGFVDAIVGGGGLIQTPSALIILPSHAAVSVIGSLKIPAFSGTASAAIQYVKKVKLKWKLISVICTTAFFSSWAGSLLLTKVANHFVKPLLLVVLVLVAIYTYTKKDFGQHVHKVRSENKEMLYAVIISITLGFYDGFIGPGTGSFLILAFISLLGFDFLKASAHAKLVNLSTNLGSIFLFFMKAKIIWLIAIPMAACNALGGLTGAKLALAKGNGFIRIFFLIVVIGTLLRFTYDVFFK